MEDKIHFESFHCKLDEVPPTNAGRMIILIRVPYQRQCSFESIIFSDVNNDTNFKFPANLEFPAINNDTTVHNNPMFVDNSAYSFINRIDIGRSQATLRKQINS